jgi:hypothetical protein
MNNERWFRVRAADAALHFHVANMAANHFEGVTIPPTNRDYPSTTWNTYTYEPGKPHASHLIHWLYWADAQNWTPAEIDRSDGNFVVYAAVSSWRPPAAIQNLARSEVERVWAYLRGHYLSNRAYEDYECLFDCCGAVWNQLTPEQLRSICHTKWIPPIDLS